MTLKTSALAVFCLLLGVLLGRMSINHDSPYPSLDNAETLTNPLPVSAKDSANRKGFSLLPNTLNTKNTEENEQLVVVPASLLEGVRGAQVITSLDQDLFHREDAAEKFLQISEIEKIALQREWRQLAAQVRQLEAAASTSEDIADGSVKIIVPEMVERIAAMSNAFEAATANVLDSNRAHVFLSIKGIESALKKHAAERSYLVDVESTGDGHWRYKITAQNAAGLSQIWVGGNVPPAIRHLTDAARIDPNLNPSEETEENQ